MEGQKTTTTTASGQQQQQQQGQQQEFPTFCYTNVSALELHFTTFVDYTNFSLLFYALQGTSTMNLAQLTTTDDNKTCYISAQPFSYNYALVNQFPNGIASIATVDGRIQVVNKPLAVRIHFNLIDYKRELKHPIFKFFVSGF